MKGSAKTCFGDIKTINTYVGNQYLNVNAEGKRRLAVGAKQKWTHDYYVKRMKKLDKDFNGHDEDGGGPCHTHLMAKGHGEVTPTQKKFRSYPHKFCPYFDLFSQIQVYK